MQKYSDVGTLLILMQDHGFIIFTNSSIQYKGSKLGVESQHDKQKGTNCALSLALKLGTCF